MARSMFSLSDSSTSEADSDHEDYLFSTALKKPKNDLTTSKSPVKPQSPSKKVPCEQPKMPRKTDEEKRQLLESKKKKKEERRKIQEETKRKQKEEKERIADEKKRQKDEKKKTGDLLKQLKPDECMKFITAFVDLGVSNDCKFGQDIVSALREAAIKCKLCNQRVPDSITWQRDVDHPDIVIPDHVLILWSSEKLINLISNNNLNTTVKDLLSKHPHHKLTILIVGMEEYFRKRKNAENRAFRAAALGQGPIRTEISSPTEEDVEMALVSLQVVLNVMYRLLDTKEEVCLFVTQLTKAIANLPHKLIKHRNDERNDWFAEADSKECIRVDTDGNGLLRLWQQQICQFPLAGLDMAQTIASKYSSPTSLMEAYDQCSQKEGELLLQDIQVRRGSGPLATDRRVGPELSKKMYKLFNSLDGNLMLSKEA